MVRKKLSYVVVSDGAVAYGAITGMLVSLRTSNMEALSSLVPMDMTATNTNDVLYVFMFNFLLSCGYLHNGKEW